MRAGDALARRRGARRPHAGDGRRRHAAAAAGRMTAPDGRPALGTCAAGAAERKAGSGDGADAVRPRPAAPPRRRGARRAGRRRPATPPLAALLATFSWQELRTTLGATRPPAGGDAGRGAGVLGAADQCLGADRVFQRGALGQRPARPRAARLREGGFDEALFARVAAHPQVSRWPARCWSWTPDALAAGGQRVALRVLGVDALVVRAAGPGLMPGPAERGEPRLACSTPGTVFLNPAARRALGREGRTASCLVRPCKAQGRPLDCSVAGTRGRRRGRRWR